MLRLVAGGSQPSGVVPVALASPLGGRGTWAVPAVPAAAAALRGFLAAHPAVHPRPDVERLLRDLELLPNAATAVIHMCEHREIGDRIHEAFPGAAMATGRVSADERSAHVARFQEDQDCRLIVGSFDAAGVGLTLTAASNVAFLEMAWTPAVHDQAEDRVHPRLTAPDAQVASSRPFLDSSVWCYQTVMYGNDGTGAIR